MSIPVFADLYKPVKDALTKAYQGDTYKLEVTTKDVVKFNPTFTRNADGSIVGNLSVEGDYVPCKHAQTKLKYAINEKGILNTKVTVDNMPSAKGLKFEAIADLAIGADLRKDKYELKCEFKGKKSTLTGSVKQDMSAEASAVLAIQDLQLGAQLSCDLLTKEIKGNQVGVSYSVTKGTSIAAILENLQTLKAGFCTTTAPWTWAGEYSCKVNGTNHMVTVGTETTLKDGQTVKARVNTAGVVGAVIIHKLSPQLKLTSSVEIDTAAGFKSKFGSQFVWEN